MEVFDEEFHREEFRYTKRQLYQSNFHLKALREQNNLSFHIWFSYLFSDLLDRVHIQQ